MQKSRKFKTGIFLIILSTLLFISLLGVPFIDAPGKTKVTISTVIVVLGEATFWLGGLLLGKEIFNKYKSYINPKNWFRKKSVQSATETVQNDN